MTQKIQKRDTHPLTRKPQNACTKPQPNQLAPTQSKKCKRVVGSSTKNNLVSDQRRCTKKCFNFCKEKTLFLKTMSFLVFQTVQKRHNGPAFQALLQSLVTKDPLHPNRVSQTKEEMTQETPKREKGSSQSTLAFAQ